MILDFLNSARAEAGLPAIEAAPATVPAVERPPSWWDNFQLGGFGVVDLAFGTNYAANEYAEQAAEGKATYSTALQSASPDDVHDAALAAGTAATNAGALQEAAGMTAAQVGAPLGSILKIALAVGAVAVVVGGVILVIRVTK